MIEAMACGTPVIAFRSGSVPEVVDEEITGFVVDGEEKAVAAAHRLKALDRRRVRARFEERFTASEWREIMCLTTIHCSAKLIGRLVPT
jgi:glycosyltransferase involved in cell wall biosynthesis